MRTSVLRARQATAVMILSALVGALLSACGASSSSSGVIEVVGAESQYANVLAEIGGSYVHATAVMSSPVVDPHSYEAGTAIARSIAAARLIVQNGMGYDDFMGQLESATAGAHRRVLIVQRLVGASETGFNPHLWYSPTTMPIVARAIEAALARILPTHASYFATNLSRLESQLGKWEASVVRFRSSRHRQNAAVTEPVADYLLSAMGINVSSPRQFQADVMNGVDPAPQDIARQEDLLDNGRVGVFCYNRQVTDSLTTMLLGRARSAQVAIVAVYEIMPRGYSYVTWMEAETVAIENALVHGRSTVRL